MSDQQHRVSNQSGYDQWSQFYDDYPNPTVAIDELHFPSVWAHLRGKLVLEIGCGTGRHTVKLAAAGNRVYGIDPSAGMLEVARRKLPRSGVTLIAADFLTYRDFPADPFDAAVSSLVLEHVRKLSPFFERVASVLAPGGEFFLSEIHPARAAGGILAHFRDPATGAEYHLDSYAHSAADIEAAAAKSGLAVKERLEIVGDARLAALSPKWEKYRNQPMIQIWVFGS